MTDHRALLWLPGALRARGVNVIELRGWEANQPAYYWTDETFHHRQYAGDPVGWMWHHTASARYVPFVKNSRGQTKANLWMGLWRDGVLYAAGQGTPTVVFASGGPANYSAGSGRREVLVDFVANDARFNGPQRKSDTPNYYGNRHFGATETVHRGDGSKVADGVWEIQLITAALMCEHYGWSLWRHIGHSDHTRRKIDPRFEQGAPSTIALMQDSIDGLGGQIPAVTVAAALQPAEEVDMRTVRYGDGSRAAPDPVVRAAQIMLAHHGYADPNTTAEESGADGIFRSGTRAVTERFQDHAGIPVTGEVDAATWKALDSAVADTR